MAGDVATGQYGKHACDSLQNLSVSLSVLWGNRKGGGEKGEKERSRG